MVLYGTVCSVFHLPPPVQTASEGLGSWRFRKPVCSLNKSLMPRLLLHVALVLMLVVNMLVFTESVQMNHSGGVVSLITRSRGAVYVSVARVLSVYFAQ